ncbi:unnamed protein product [Calicophoron daubneyi]|uniref:MARVEL domain-containing protein n=1 Tax=Calicophoron daubneyi TaxID=300641 RepID=A0AAV2SYP8_CALDB
MMFSADRALVIKLAFVLSLLTISLCLPHWEGGYIFNAWNESLIMLSVGTLLFTGVICLGILFVMEVITTFSGEGCDSSVCQAVKIILISLGGIALLAGLVIHQIRYPVHWSFVLSLCACTLVIDMSLWMAGQQPRVRL